MFRSIFSAAACSFILSLAGQEINWLAPGPVRQNAFTSCKVDFSPGPQYRTEKRQWQGCPTLLRTPKGTLYAGWYSGGPGEGLLNYSLMTRSTDGGLTWEKEPLLVIDSLTDKKIQSLDIQYWLDPKGRFWYFWTQRDYNYKNKDPRHLSVWAMICEDPDAEKLQWSAPRFISPGFLRSQPTVLKDGRWILCAYDWVDAYYRYSESFDEGRSWHRRIAGKKHLNGAFAFDETMMLEENDGTLRLLARSLKKVGYLVECRSRDGGKTWTPGILCDIPNPSSRFFIKRLRSGNILLINNFDKNDRYHLMAALSTDDGKTWPHKLLLDPRRCTYPDAVEGEDGELFIIHDFARGNAKEILLSRITERDIMTGLQKNALTDDNSFLRHIISKAPSPAKLTPEEEKRSDLFRSKNNKSKGVRIHLELMGKPFNNKLNQISHQKGLSFERFDSGTSFRIRSEQPLSETWQTYTFSFVAQKPKLTFNIRANGWVDYDDFQVVNGTLLNPSFEQFNARNEAACWRYYDKSAIRKNRSDAADGKVFLTTTSRFPARQMLRVTPEKKVTVTFKARIGSRFRPGNTPWTSSAQQ